MDFKINFKKARKQKEVITISRERMDRDVVLSVGLLIRRRASAMFFSNFLCPFLVLLKSPYIDIPVIIYMIATYAYSRTFYTWEKKNAEYLRGLGFDVK